MFVLAFSDQTQPERHHDSMVAWARARRRRGCGSAEGCEQDAETFTVTPGGPTRASAARACSCGGGREMKKNKSASGDEDVTNLFQQYDHREKL